MIPACLVDSCEFESRQGRQFLGKVVECLGDCLQNNFMRVRVPSFPPIFAVVIPQRPNGYWHLAVNQDATGSSPVWGAIFNASIAQWEERLVEAQKMPVQFRLEAPF